jgi:hypothetical protein
VDAGRTLGTGAHGDALDARLAVILGILLAAVVRRCSPGIYRQVVDTIAGRLDDAGRDRRTDDDVSPFNITIENTIIARHRTLGPACEGTITSLGHNIIGNTTGCAVNLLPTDHTGNPGFGVFANGVVPLLSTSQATPPLMCRSSERRAVVWSA